MKRFFTICLIPIFCLLLFSGCGQNNEDKNETDSYEQNTTTTDSETAATDIDEGKDDTMQGDDGSLWDFDDDGEVTVTAADGSETVYTYRLTTVTAYLTNKATGEEIKADVEYDDDGSITLFFDDNTAVILTQGQS